MDAINRGEAIPANVVLTSKAGSITARDKAWADGVIKRALAKPETQGEAPIPSPSHTVPEWTGSQDPCDPDNFWIDDATGERVSATGERMAHSCLHTVPKACGFTKDHGRFVCGQPPTGARHACNGTCNQPTRPNHDPVFRCHPYQDDGAA